MQDNAYVNIFFAVCGIVIYFIIFNSIDLDTRYALTQTASYEFLDSRQFDVVYKDLERINSVILDMKYYEVQGDNNTQKDTFDFVAQRGKLLIKGTLILVVVRNTQDKYFAVMVDIETNKVVTLIQIFFKTSQQPLVHLHSDPKDKLHFYGYFWDRQRNTFIKAKINLQRALSHWFAYFI
jgi:hypothetical protein